MRRLCLLLAAVLTAAGVAVADDLSPAEKQLNAIIAEAWEFELSESPLAATFHGRDEFNDRMPSATRADQLRRQAAKRRFLVRTRDLDRSSLSANGRINADLFEWVLRDDIDAYELNLARIPFNTFYGFFMAALSSNDGVIMDSPEDYEDYIARMRDIPRFFDENLENMRSGVSTGFVLPQIVIDGVLPTIAAQVKEDPEESSFYDPFREMNDRVDDLKKVDLREQARAAIADSVMPAFARVAAFLQDEYAASDSIAAEDLDEGKAYYAFNIRRYTTLETTTAAQIHEQGLVEVERIRGEMERLLDDVEFDGDLQAFSEYLRNDPRFYADSPEQLLKEAAYIAKRIDYVLPGFFGKLPRQTYGVVPVPDEIAPNYTTGAYNGSPPGGAHGGKYLVNTYALDQRPLYELPSLTLHEAVPGHHFQAALSLELEDVPEFRRNLYFSAFGEGWALYTEKLGVEMGIYQTPYEHFGRLSYEMWRACRLVIDTGLHSQGWTRQRAMDFFFANTLLSEGNIRAEVDRYISWPGQALAYKLGEMKIWELRRRAESDLGELFDLREFHDALLGHGAVPLAMLEEIIGDYIYARLDAQE